MGLSGEAPPESVVCCMCACLILSFAVRAVRVAREVKDSVEAFKRDFARFEALQREGRPDEVQHAQKELLSQLKTLNW